MKRIFLLSTLCAFSFLSINGQNALDFDGTNDKIIVGNPANLQISGTNITVEAWIYPTAWKSPVWQGNVVNQENNSTNDGFMLRVGEQGKINFGFGDAGTSWREITTPSGTVALNTWTHIAATYDGNYVRLYKNGGVVDSMIASTPVVAGNVPLMIGARNNDRFYQGKIDEVRIWTVTRTKAEINQGMNAEFCGVTPGLQLYYKLNEGVAGGNNTGVNTTKDYSGNNNDGTLSGFSLNSAGSNWVNGVSLTVPQSVTGSKADTLCKGYTYYVGNKKYTKAGVYIDTLNTTFGCDSIVTLTLYADSVDVSSSYVGYTLKADNNNATYQWIKCPSGFYVGGETSQTFSPSDNGYYACLVTEGACTDTTECMSLVYVGVEENELLRIKLYPNPANSVLHLSGFQIRNGMTYQVVNSLGNIAMKGKLEGNISVEHLANGIYTLIVETDNTQRAAKFIKL